MRGQGIFTAGQVQWWGSEPASGGPGVSPPENFLKIDTHFGAFWCILALLNDFFVINFACILLNIMTYL
jgi:hypothetical protein